MRSGSTHGGNPAILIATAAICTLLIVVTCLDVRRVDGTSMEPTLTDGETIVVMRLAYGFRPRSGRYLFVWKQVQPNDIIVFEHPETGTKVVKRCLGVEGDLVWPNGPGVLLAHRDEDGAWKIPDGKLYVAGDDPSTSVDSRDYGLIDSSTVHGRVIFPQASQGSDG